MSDFGKSLLSGRVLSRSVAWNFGGLIAPMFVGLIAIPLLIDGMGKERFGLLAIIWMGVGYFSLFDMGFGRALTKLIAERLGSEEDLGSLIWTALFLILVLGFIGALVVGLIASPLVRHILNVGVQLQAEAITAFHVLAIGLPVIVVTSALRGILEAHQRFATITAIRIPSGLFTFLGPLASVQFSPSLVWATTVLLAVRVLAFSAYFLVAISIHRELRFPRLPRSDDIRSLFLFGGWLTITNIIGPLMDYFDRFFIGAILSMTAVTYYVTPYEVVSQLRIIPQSIMNVLFPALTTSIAMDRERLPRLYSQTAQVLLLLMLPVTSAFFLFAPEALQLWLGSEFRVTGTPVVQWLALGMLINTLARPSSTLLQSAGRPDLVAKTHMLELIPYILGLWWLTLHFGIAGTAATWFLRVLVDTLVLNEVVRRKFADLSFLVQQTYIITVGLLVSFFIVWFIDLLVIRALIFLVVIIVCGIRFWLIFRALLRQSHGRNDISWVGK